MAREHITDSSLGPCWCAPVTLAYGDEVVSDAEGNVIAINQEPEDDEAAV
jgi:hypothetical protein